jgi:hypothetical protein
MVKINMHANFKELLVRRLKNSVNALNPHEINVECRAPERIMPSGMAKKV